MASYNRLDFMAFLTLECGGLTPSQAENVTNEVERLLREARKELARHVNATSDEYGMDVEASIGRMCDLLAAVSRDEDPSTYHRFHAPPEDDEEDE